MILNYVTAYDPSHLRCFLLALLHSSVRNKFASNYLSLFFFAISDQRSLATVVDMGAPTSTLLHTADIDRDCQTSPRGMVQRLILIAK